MNRTEYLERGRKMRESRECNAPIVWLRRPVPLSPLCDIPVVGVSSDHPELVAEYEARVRA